MNAQPRQKLVDLALLVVMIMIVILLIMAIMNVNLNEVNCRVASAFGGGGNCEVLCSDTFDTISNWNSLYPGGWETTDGMLRNASSGEQLLFDRCSNSQSHPIPDDYEINIGFINLIRGDGYGIFFRMESTIPSNGYIFQYDPGFGAFTFRRWVNGYELPPFAVSDPLDYSWYDQAHSIRIVVDGDHFIAYVDDEMVLAGEDATFPSGGVGFRTWDETVVYMDDYQIELIQ
jgi:hypothetical protein